MRRIDHKTGARVNRLFEGFLAEIAQGLSGVISGV
jgi:hypothetical protein